MWVNEARHQDTAASIKCRFMGIGGFQFSRRADRDDLFIAHDDCAVFDNSKRAKGMTALRAVGQSEELRGGVDEHDYRD
jgi:hypothetical protein